LTQKCPCDRSCSDCVYHSICGGCLEENCIHIRIEERKTLSDGCLFCHKKGLASSEYCSTLIPPKKIDCISPWILEDTIDIWIDHRESFADQQNQSSWPLLIPELSEISETTSRLSVNENEGNWKFNNWNPVAWDMTGYLIDKVQGPQWIPKKDVEDESWRYIIGSKYNWVENLLMVDRLPDYLALQTPPSSIIAEYLNRLHACQWNLESDDDAPDLWLLTHGYPSYIDWPPAWHWNLGIRMLSSLIEYTGAAMSNNLQAPKGTWYHDKSGKTKGPIKAPFVDTRTEARLLYPVHTEMDWVKFPNIIPFIPGADIHQISWFAKQIASWGYEVLALDALNSISHENFKGLPEAVNVLKNAGASHVLVYGPWPLHIPSKYVPSRNVSYIPCSHHMDMTNTPARFWIKKEQQINEEWRNIPSYRTTSLSQLKTEKFVEVCSCSACRSGNTLETDSRSIWRWGHLLNAGRKWQKRIRSKDSSVIALSDDLVSLWYQGPSSTAFRRYLHHKDTRPHDCADELYDSVKIDETDIKIIFPDEQILTSECIRWTGLEGPDWRTNFPKLGDT